MTLMKIVGHTTPNMASHYAHQTPNSLKGATDCQDGKRCAPVVQNTAPCAVGGGPS